MAPIATGVTQLTNTIISSLQLLQYQQSHSSLATASSELFAASILTQAAGILLRLPQEVIATSIVILQRYLILCSPDSNLHCSTEEASAASIFLCAKLSFYPLAPRSVVNVYAYLSSKASPLQDVDRRGPPDQLDAKEYFVSEGTFERKRQTLFVCEKKLLAAIGFDTQVILPYSLALTYLQTLGTSSQLLGERVFAHLNGALVSPQLLYLTNQPNALAVAAIYLAAREVGVKLVEENWWEIFDVDREDLGFLVLAYGSLGNYAAEERKGWQERSASLAENMAESVFLPWF